MGLSLQEQLLKAGLADKKQANKARQEKRVNRKKNKGKTPAPEINQAQKKAQAQAERSRELNRRINEEKQRVENKAQIRQLIAQNRLDLKKCDEPYHFVVGKKVKKLWVNEEIAQKLSRGQLAIVTADGAFDIVTAGVAQQVADRDPDAVVLMHEPGSDA